MNILHVAQNVFKEAIRDRIMYTIVFFALLCLGTTWFLAELSMRQEEKIITDLGFSAITLFALIITIFLGSSMLFRETEKGTIHILLSKPISRTSFLLGKWLGIGSTVAVNIALMAVVFALLLLGRGFSLPHDFLVSLLLLITEVLFVAAVTVFFSSCTSPLITTVATIAITLAGHMMHNIRSLLLMDTLKPASAAIAKLLIATVPNLDMLNAQNQIAHGIAVTGQQIAWTLLYIGSFTAVLLVAGCWIFGKKDF